MTHTIHRQNKIITFCTPCPARSFDWCAYHEGDEATNRLGFGATEAEALADLALKDEERAEAFMHIAFRDEADALAEEQ